MPPHEQQPAPAAPAAADSERPPILDVVVKGNHKGYTGRYVLTEEVWNDAPVWQQLGSRRCIYYCSLGEDPAPVMRWMFGRPPLPSESGYEWVFSLMAAEGCSASTPPQSVGAWVSILADISDRVPRSVSISVPERDLTHDADRPQQPAPVAPAVPGDSQRPPILDVVARGRFKKYTGRYVLTEEVCNSAPMWQQLGSERRINYSYLSDGPANVKRWVFCCPTPPSETEYDWIRDLMAAEGCSASTPPQSVGAWLVSYQDVSKRVPASVRISVPDLESEMAERKTAEAALAAERHRSEAAQAEKGAAERALEEERRRAAAALAEEQRRAAAALESERAERRAAEQALAAERRCATAALSAKQDAELQLRREAEGRRAQEAKRLTAEEAAARRALELEGAGTLADLLLEREADLRLAEAATQLSAEEAAGRQKVRAAAFEGFCDLHQGCAGAAARAAERRRSAQGQLSATAVDEAEQRRAAEAQCLAELAAVFREAAASTASAERRAGGREALAVAEADARAAAEAEQRATRAEAIREWEQRVAQLHRAAAAEELRRVSAAADAERERAAAAERAAALAAGRVRGAEQQAAEARRAASQAEEALRAAEVQHRVAAAAAEGRRAAEAEALLRAAAAARQRSDEVHAALLCEIEQIGGGGGRRQRSPAAAAGPAAPSPHGHAAGGARAAQGASRRSATAVLPPAVGRSRTTIASGAAERCRATVSTPDAVRDSVGDVLRSFFSASEELRALGRWEVAKVRRKGKGPQWRLILPCDLSPEAEAALTAAWTRRFRVDGRFTIVTPSVLAAEAAAVPLPQTRSHSAPPHCRVTRSEVGAGDGDGDAGAGGRPVAWETDASSLYESAL